MPEKLQPVDLEKLSPEYWDGHGPNDECPWIYKPPHPIIPLHQDGAVKKFARDTLTRYLAEGNVNPIRTFNSGEVFDGTKFPNGTIIKFDSEALRIKNEDASWKNPYISFVSWGIICDYFVRGKKEQLVLPFIDFSSQGQLLQSEPREPIMRVGQTQHRRIEAGSSHFSESLVRVNSLAIYRIT